MSNSKNKAITVIINEPMNLSWSLGFLHARAGIGPSAQYEKMPKIDQMNYEIGRLYACTAPAAPIKKNKEGQIIMSLKLNLALKTVGEVWPRPGEIQPSSASLRFAKPLDRRGWPKAIPEVRARSASASDLGL